VSMLTALICSETPVATTGDLAVSMAMSRDVDIVAVLICTAAEASAAVISRRKCCVQ